MPFSLSHLCPRHYPRSHPTLLSPPLCRSPPPPPIPSPPSSPLLSYARTCLCYCQMLGGGGGEGDGARMVAVLIVNLQHPCSLLEAPPDTHIYTHKHFQSAWLCTHTMFYFHHYPSTQLPPRPSARVNTDA